MEQLPEALIGAGLLIIKSVCSDYDYLTVTMVFICIHIFKFLPLTFTFSTVSILKTFLFLDFKCYKDHECSYMYGWSCKAAWCWVHAFGGLFACPVVCE